MVEDGAELAILGRRDVVPEGEIGEPDAPARPEDAVELADEPRLVVLGHADVARRLEAHDRVEGGVGEVEHARVGPAEGDAVGEAPLGDERGALSHLLAADVHAGDVAGVAGCHPERRRGETAADVENRLGALDAGEPGDEVGVRVEPLGERLLAVREVAEVEAVSVEQAPVVGDQVEVGADAPRRAPSTDEAGQAHSRGRADLPRAAGETVVLPGGDQDTCSQLTCSSLDRV